MNRNLSRTIVGGALVCLHLAILFTALPVAVAPQADSPDIGNIDVYISAQMQVDHIPGVALGLVHNDQVMHLRGFGEVDSSGRAVTARTPFILASVSKSFTALAIMQLVEAGKIELDVPVQRYLPWFRLADADALARISGRYLLYHTSGLPASACETDQVAMTLEQIVHSLATVTLDRAVGSRYEYCSANYDVLGLIVQTVSGQPYGAYIERLSELRSFARCVRRYKQLYSIQRERFSVFQCERIKNNDTIFTRAQSIPVSAAIPASQI